MVTVVQLVLSFAAARVTVEENIARTLQPEVGNDALHLHFSASNGDAPKDGSGSNRDSNESSGKEAQQGDKPSGKASDPAAVSSGSDADTQPDEFMSKPDSVALGLQMTAKMTNKSNE